MVVDAKWEDTKKEGTTYNIAQSCPLFGQNVQNEYK